MVAAIDEDRETYAKGEPLLRSGSRLSLVKPTLRTEFRQILYVGDIGLANWQSTLNCAYLLPLLRESWSCTVLEPSASRLDFTATLLNYVL